ncbi:MAG: signal peptidase I [Sedimentisphaerales bacterium]|nr:signal peptidase I [Sedimentisphaerales bacterium]
MDNTVKNNKRRIWVALMLSLIMPGLGQVYCGKLSRGFFLTFLNILPLPLILGLFLLSDSLMLAPITVILILFGFAIQVFSIIDSSLLAKRAGADYELKEYNRWYVYLLLVLIVSGCTIGSGLYLRDQCLEAFSVPTASCYPSILPGDKILASKNAYKNTDPQRGDLIVFINPENRHVKFIKRVVAIAGDTVEMKNNELYINGQKLKVEKLPDSIFDKIRLDDSTKGEFYQETNDKTQYKILLSDSPEKFTQQDFEKTTIPKYHCFVLGDNRNNSYDSRNFGCVPLATIIARADFVYWPAKDFSRLGGLN